MTWRRGPIRILALGLAVGWFGLGLACSTSSSKNGEVEQTPPIESESKQVQQEFERAVRLLEDRRWEEAVAEFRLLQGEYATDETAALAELYIARGLLGDVADEFEAGAVDVDRDVFGLLEPLAEATEVDDRIRFGAQSYLAVAHALEGDLEEARAVLQDYPSASLSPKILEGDERWIWPLLAEGLARADRPAESVLAWSALHELVVEAFGPDEDAGSQSPAGGPTSEGSAEVETPPLADLAVTRAFEHEDRLEEDVLREFLTEDRPLARAVAGWTIIRRGLDEVDETADEETIHALQSVFNEVAPDFVTVGATDRASELSVAIAAVSEPERLVIGALLPLTGPNRAVGRRALAGMLVAQRAFHATGEPSVTLVIEDSHERDVREAYRRLADHQALAVVGPLATTSSRALVEPAAEVGVPVVTLAADRLAAAEDLNEIGEDDAGTPVFRNFVDAVAEARAAARISFDRLEDRRAAVVYPDMGYGRLMSRAFAEEFRALGGEIVVETEYDREASDYVELASRVAAAEPEAIFLPDTGSKAAEISAFFAQEQIWGVAPEAVRPDDGRIHVHYLGTSLWQSPMVVEQAGDYLEGAVVPAWFAPQFDDAHTRQFVQSFEAIYETSPDPFVAFAYDTVDNLRSLVVERGTADGTDVAEALGQGKFQRGATGRHYFGPDGEPRRTLRYLTVDDSRWTILDHRIETPLEGRSEIEEELDDQHLDPIDDETVDEPAAPGSRD